MKNYVLAACALVTVPVFAQIPPVTQIPQLASAHAMKATRVQQRSEVAVRTQRVFTRVDANRDGAIDQAELAAVGNRRGGRRGEGGQDRTARFDRLDANRDGSLSRDEFARPPGAGAERKMAMRDHRGDGGMMRGRHGGGMARLFTTADANRDSRVTLPEATAAALSHFDRIDTNRDGQLTREERAAGRTRWQQQRGG